MRSIKYSFGNMEWQDSRSRIEGISAYLQDEPLSHLLGGWYRNDPGRYWSFQTIENSVIHSHGLKNNAHLEATFEAVFKNAILILFPGATLAGPE